MREERGNSKGLFSPLSVIIRDPIYIGVFINTVISTSIMIHR